MKSLVLYSYPVELDGVSIQGEMLFKGLAENGTHAARCHLKSKIEKEFLYKTFKTDVAIGIGYWGDTPEVVLHPQKFGITSVPWFNADGWIANYHDVLNSLPLMFVTSNWVRERYIRDGVTNENMVVSPIGIDTNEMKPMPRSDERIQKIRTMLGIKPDEKMILTIGGDTTSKGFQEVLLALGKIGSEFENWKYVGKSWQCPSYHRKKEMQIMEECNIDRDKVIFMDGPMSRDFTCQLINACDIYAAPSRIEGFGMVQVEAQSCAKPVLSINAMGVKDTIIHGETGYLAKVGQEVILSEEWVYKKHGFPNKEKIQFQEPKVMDMRADIDDIAKYLLKLLTDEELCRNMGKKGREHAVRNFNYRVVSDRISSIIKEKLGLQ